METIEVIKAEEIEGKTTTDELAEMMQSAQKVHETGAYWICAEDLKEAYDFALANDGQCILQLKCGNLGAWLEVKKERDSDPVSICNADNL